MKRYFKLFLAKAFYAINSQAIYRFSFIWIVLTRTALIGLSIMLFAFIYQGIPTLNGWSYWQAIIVVGISGIIGSLHFAFIDSNLSQLPDLIRDGQLDLYLTKPVDVQFLVSTDRVLFHNLPNVLFNIAVVVYALVKLGVVPTFGSVILTLVILVGSLIIIYSLMLALMTIAFWLIKMYEIDELLRAVLLLTRYPASIYQGAIRFVFLYLVPIIFVSTVPAELLIGRYHNFDIIYMIIVPIVAFIVARWFFYFGLKSYSSASS